MKKVFTYKAGDDNGVERLDIFLVGKMRISRSLAQKKIAAGFVIVNGKLPKKAGDMLKNGAKIEVDEENLNRVATEEEGEDVLPEIEVVAETKDYLVVVKPAGVLTHPTDANETGTLVDWLKANYPKIKKVGDDDRRPGIVHRLDRDASGLLVIARTQKMFELLKRQFQDRTIEKIYTTLVHGVVDKDHDFIDFPIDRGGDGRMVARPRRDLTSLRSVSEDMGGKEAITEFFVKKRFTRFSLLEVKIHTGRMHQIRVHMFAYNHPVVGDTLYLNKKLNRKRERNLGRLFLHAEKLCFNDLAGERVCFESELPVALRHFLHDLN